MNAKRFITPAISAIGVLIVLGLGAAMEVRASTEAAPPGLYLPPSHSLPTIPTGKDVDLTVWSSVPLTTTTPSPTFTITPVPPTETPCPPMSFTDVQPTDFFYTDLNYLYCHGVISGYDDGTFRPGNNVNRGQLCKILVLGFNLPPYMPPTPTFCDVLPDNPYFVFIETFWYHGRPDVCIDCECFRPYDSPTRGQFAKILVLLACWPVNTTGGPHFNDVVSDNPFYAYIETVYNRGIISGYADGTFRPHNYITRDR